jgi:hypothetical protein
MCRAVMCKKSDKILWKGYAAHIEQVPGDVQPGQGRLHVPTRIAKRRFWYSR